LDSVGVIGQNKDTKYEQSQTEIVTEDGGSEIVLNTESFEI
jgi:hypothetical protein